MRFGSLFSGIGGLDLGFEQSGFECAAQVENNADCNRVLEKRFPDVSRYADVKDVGRLPAADVICGGFPCQDLSVAGQRKGLAGERSGLWFEFLRVIESNLPRWIVIENVPGLLSSDESQDFAVILRGLVDVGYCLAWRVLDAQYYGVAQRRRRVFIVGSLGNGSCAEILFESESVSWNPPTRREAGQRVAEVSVRRAQTGSNGWGVRTDGSTGTLDGTGGDAVIAATLDQRGRGPTDAVMMNLQLARTLSYGRTQNHYDESQQTYIAFQQDATDKFSEDVAPTMRGKSNGGTRAFGVSGDFGVRRLTPTECERLQGFPDSWTAVDAEGKAISDSARYRMLGNAVAVPVAEWIARRIQLAASASALHWSDKSERVCLHRL